MLTGGLSEGASPTAANGHGGAVGVGALTLASTSPSSLAVLNFGSTQTGSALVFSSLSTNSKGGYVSVLGFTTTSVLNGDNGASTNDRLLFASDPGFTTTDLAHWQFSDDAGTVISTGGAEIAYNGYFEIVPVPEPATWLGGLGLLASAVLILRRRQHHA